MMNKPMHIYCISGIAARSDPNIVHFGVRRSKHNEKPWATAVYLVLSTDTLSKSVSTVNVKGDDVLLLTSGWR